MPRNPPPDPVTENCLHRLEGHRTNEEYLADKGWKCPYCHRDGIKIVRRKNNHVIMANSSNSKLRRLVQCTHCEKEYWDIHELGGWAPHAPGDEDERAF